jgi:hypothetical protein
MTNQLNPLKLSCALVSCDENSLYLDFWPLVKKAWNQIVKIPVKLILIANHIPTQYIGDEDIILFPPIEGLHTAFIAQCIRLFYPALLNYDDGIIISDMDMIPTQYNYYHHNLQSVNINKDTFVNYRNCIAPAYPEYPICYNVATPHVWSQIFKIKSLDDITTNLKLVYQTINYNGIHGGLGWSTDQLYLYKVLNNWHQATGQLVLLYDSQTKFTRLDRIDHDITNLSDHRRQLIKDHYYCDYHMLRPYQQYKAINDEILNLLC